MTEPRWAERLTDLALEAHGEEPCIEHGCLMMVSVLQMPDRVRLRMATVFLEFAMTLEVMREESTP
jgi:hypothetical protein